MSSPRFWPPQCGAWSRMSSKPLGRRQVGWRVQTHTLSNTTLSQRTFLNLPFPAARFCTSVSFVWVLKKRPCFITRLPDYTVSDNFVLYGHYTPKLPHGLCILAHSCKELQQVLGRPVRKDPHPREGKKFHAGEIDASRTSTLSTWETSCSNKEKKERRRRPPTTSRTAAEGHRELSEIDMKHGRGDSQVSQWENCQESGLRSPNWKLTTHDSKIHIGRISDTVALCGVFTNSKITTTRRWSTRYLRTQRWCMSCPCAYASLNQFLTWTSWYPAKKTTKSQRGWRMLGQTAFLQHKGFVGATKSTQNHCSLWANPPCESITSLALDTLLWTRERGRRTVGKCM